MAPLNITNVWVLNATHITVAINNYDNGTATKAAAPQASPAVVPLGRHDQIMLGFTIPAFCLLAVVLAWWARQCIKRDHKRKLSIALEPFKAENAHQYVYLSRRARKDVTPFDINLFPLTPAGNQPEEPPEKLFVASASLALAGLILSAHGLPPPAPVGLALAAPATAAFPLFRSRKAK
ncbi:uncharacterized protein LDX57_010682 [Aspergillus melleus]|uniref:uncharacterized protein n=1 Tax=Aspergillus melleus TaxID=138277 RepID=UPI001E8E516C|nr:uncharacterized protein LDX57_010682 [Aspergillus melleus]KAH8433043.1 hypothetical protein LDX57_010682 [Aspergillus melleus]